MTPFQLISIWGTVKQAVKRDTSEFPVDILNERGADHIEHALGSFGDHLLRTAALLRSWGASRDVFLGGLFHSAYGSPYVPVFLFDEHERDQVRLVIGPEAEHLAFAYSILDRQVIYLPGQFGASGLPPGVGPRELEQLVQIDLANTVDQAMGSNQGPGLWISKWSAIARKFPRIRLPIFEALRQVSISKQQESDAIATYGDTLRSGLPLRSSMFARLRAAAAALALPGEPLLVAAAHLHYMGEVDEAKVVALDAARRMRALSSPWDKRASSDSWLALATALPQSPVLTRQGRRS